MTYKYFLSGSPPFFDTVGDYFLNNFQENLDIQFSNAPDTYTIEEESPFASGSYVNTQVRINQAINTYTGLKLGDDFKNLLFKDLDHGSTIGSKFIFDNNTWLGINTETYKNFASGITIRRCNNNLRWIDVNGVTYIEPCIIDYNIALPRDEKTFSEIVTPKGIIVIYAQANGNTIKIKENQRFLFGPTDNRRAYRIFGDGIRNFLNIETSDDTSARLLRIEMGGNYINRDTDNLSLGIADYYNYTSASNVNNVVVDPDTFDILESASSIYNVRCYSGNTPISGSFVFTIYDDLVPTDHYAFSVIDANNFSIINNEIYLDNPLIILASNTSASRTININLRGAW